MVRISVYNFYENKNKSTVFVCKECKMLSSLIFLVTVLVTTGETSECFFYDLDRARLILIQMVLFLEISCSDPAGHSGSCIPMESCSCIVDLLSKDFLNPDEYSYLQGSKCESEKSDSKIIEVCCPENVSKSFWQKLRQKDEFCGYTIGGSELFNSEKGEMTPHDHPWVALLEYTDGKLTLD